jgi:hypothetical protein
VPGIGGDGKRLCDMAGRAARRIAVTLLCASALACVVCELALTLRRVQVWCEASGSWCTVDVANGLFDDLSLFELAMPALPTRVTIPLVSPAAADAVFRAIAAVSVGNNNVGHDEDADLAKAIEESRREAVADTTTKTTTTAASTAATAKSATSTDKSKTSTATPASGTAMTTTKRLFPYIITVERGLVTDLTPCLSSDFAGATICLRDVRV